MATITASAYIFLLPSLIPLHLDSSIIKDFTSVDRLTSTDSSDSIFSNALITSDDLFDKGNTLSPLSTFVGQPIFSSISTISLLSNCLNALYKNFELLTTFSIIVFISEALVMLQRPLPVM